LLGLNRDEDSVNVYLECHPDKHVEKFLTNNWSPLNCVGHPLSDVHWISIGSGLQWPYLVSFGGLPEATKYSDLYPGLFAKLSNLYAPNTKSLDSAYERPVAIPLGIQSPPCLLELPSDVSRSSLGPIVSDWYSIDDDNISRNLSSALNRALDQFYTINDHFLSLVDPIDRGYTSDFVPPGGAMNPLSTMVAGNYSPAPPRSIPEPITPDDASDDVMEDVDDSSCLGDNEGGAYKLADALVNNRTTRNYAYIKEPDNCKMLPTGTTIVFLFTTGWERGAVQSMSKRQIADAAAKGYTDHVQYVSRENVYHNLTSIKCKYISEDTFKGLLGGDVTGESAGVGPGAWCIVKLN